MSNERSTNGAPSTISIDHTRHWTSTCRQAVINRARGRCPTVCQPWSTTSTKSFEASPAQKPMSASKGVCGKSHKPFAVNVLRFVNSVPMDGSEYSLPLIRSQQSICVTQKASTMSPNRCKLCLRAEQLAAMNFDHSARHLHFEA